MNVLVTGSTGLLGGNVVRQLLDRGTAVRVLVRQSADPRPLDGLDVERVIGDIRDADAVRKAVAGCQAVVHSAARVHIGWSGLAESRQINVEGTRHVAQAAAEQGARMIHVSSVDAVGMGTREHPASEETSYTPHTPCPYPITKREADLEILAKIKTGLDAVIVYPSFMLGPWDWKPSSGRMLLEVARRRPPVAPRGTNDFTHVVDVARAIVTAIDRGERGAQYILSGEWQNYLVAFRVMAEICGVRGPLISVGPVILYTAGWLGDLKAKLSGREGDVNSAAIRLLREPRFYSHAKATAELDYHPRGLKTAAQDAWRWFCEHGYDS